MAPQGHLSLLCHVPNFTSRVYICDCRWCAYVAVSLSRHCLYPSHQKGSFWTCSSWHREHTLAQGIWTAGVLVALNLPCQITWKIFSLLSARSRARGMMDNCVVACKEEKRGSPSFALSGACVGMKVRNILVDLV